MTTTYRPTSTAQMEVNFNEELTDRQREVAERSIRAMAEHSAEMRSPKRSTSEQALQAQGIRTDAGVQEIERRELSEFCARHEPDRSAVGAIGRLESPVGQGDLLPREATWVNQNHQPPFHFDWKWHRIDGKAPEFSVTNRPQGRADVKGRSLPGDPFVEAHAGFGVILRPDADGWLIGDAVRFAAWAYGVKCYPGVGSNATSEGGTEITLLEDGQYRLGQTSRMWRKRVTNDEEDVRQSNGFLADTAPLRLQFWARAHHEYTFNVGFWLYADHTSGAGSAGATSLLAGTVPSMHTVHPEIWG